jgi:hypothetical protein
MDLSANKLGNTHNPSGGARQLGSALHVTIQSDGSPPEDIVANRRVPPVKSDNQWYAKGTNNGHCVIGIHSEVSMYQDRSQGAQTG